MLANLIVGPPSEILTDFDTSAGSSPPVRSTQDESFIENAIRDGIGEDEIEKERSEKGIVSLSVYATYWKAVGHGLAFFILLSVVAMQVGRIKAISMLLLKSY